MSANPIKISAEIALELFLDNIEYALLIDKSAGEKIYDAFEEEVKEALEWVHEVILNAQKGSLDEKKITELKSKYNQNLEIQKALIEHMITNKKFWEDMKKNRIAHEKTHNLPGEQKRILDEVVKKISKHMGAALASLGYAEGGEIKEAFRKDVIPFLKELALKNDYFTKKHAHSGVTTDDIGTLNELIDALNDFNNPDQRYNVLLEKLDDAEMMAAIVHMAASRCGPRHIAAKAVEQKIKIEAIKDPTTSEQPRSEQPRLRAQVMQAAYNSKPVSPQEPKDRSDIEEKIAKAREQKAAADEKKRHEQEKYAAEAAARLKDQPKRQQPEEKPGLRQVPKKAPPPPPPPPPVKSKPEEIKAIKATQHALSQEALQAQQKRSPETREKFAQIQAVLDARNKEALQNQQKSDPMIFNKAQRAKAKQEQQESLDLADVVWKQQQKIAILTELLKTGEPLVPQDLKTDLSDIKFPIGSAEAQESRQALAKQANLKEQDVQNTEKINTLIKQLQKRDTPESILQELYMKNVDYLRKYGKFEKNEKPEKEAHRGYWLRANTKNKMKHADYRQTALEGLISALNELHETGKTIDRKNLQKINKHLSVELKKIIDKALKDDAKDQGLFSSQGEVYKMLTEAKEALDALEPPTAKPPKPKK